MPIAETSSVKGIQLSDMEREQYQNQIKDLLQAVETLLKSNKAMDERVTQLEKVADEERFRKMDEGHRIREAALESRIRELEEAGEGAKQGWKSERKSIKII